MLLGEFVGGLGLERWLRQEVLKLGIEYGYQATAYVTPLVLMPNSGGRSLEDMRILKNDIALSSLLQQDALLDKTPLLVVLTWPLECAKISGTQTLNAVASDEGEAVEKVEFLVNGKLLQRKAKPPYQISWNVKDKKPGEYTITARAYDRAGNQVEYSTVVLVNTRKASEVVCATAN
ncbi:Ig-like domain-containing protein [Nitrosomonas sp. Is37]|uniref:Ig-like domain-containing protein n=1 Tax=Nitrosomonas sp. Is37 TaxID=3080535 RepID=UPI00294B2CB1|nr:Ig-like domain-containing protein [Nitrosomonas sp. Is37]MDV6344906.1 Ig-like domain-containing protein [Nitrosomonas sp. Is37]